uniref:Uncharacterized protein n=1 Tax=Globodera rostochiensis TaxID=31243 RepID=A0A914H898_GLORO
MRPQTMANESDSSEQLADNSSSVEDEPLNVPPISNPKKQRVVTFNLVPSTESPPAQWDRLFIRQEMPKIKWLCPDNSQNAMCQNARFANRTLRKYLEYQNAAITISNAPTNDKYKKENHEKSIDKDNLLKRLALKPSFLKLSPALNNLLSAFKRGVNELESKKVKSDKIRKLVKKLKKYRRALESIKNRVVAKQALWPLPTTLLAFLPNKESHHFHWR